MKFLGLFLAMFFVLTATSPFGPIPFGVEPAYAQQRAERGRPNLLQMLFGGALRRQGIFNQRREAPDNARRVIVRPSGGGSRSVQPAPKTIVQKKENAQTVLVAGDFFADGLHWGLQQAFSQNANVVFADKSSGLSGLVRDDVLDWPARIGGFIDETQPIAVIILVGANDRQQLRMPGGRIEKLTEEWTKEYGERIDRLVAEVRGRNLPLIWIGLPAVRRSNMNADYLKFNEMYRSRVEAAGGQFVDVWDGYTNAEGAFISAGPDINGQIVRLRNSDGINMTRAGKRKLAFYAERALRLVTGIGGESVELALPGTGGGEFQRQPDYDPAQTGRTIVVSLNDPRVDGAAALEGGTDPVVEGEAVYSTSYRLVHDGVLHEAKPGRIDAGWGRPEDPEARALAKADVEELLEEAEPEPEQPFFFLPVPFAPAGDSDAGRR